MHLTQISLKTRLITLTSIIIILIVGIVIFGQQLNSSSSSRNIDSSNLLQKVKISLSKINSILQVTEKELYEQIIMSDEDRADSIIDSYDILLTETKKLVKNEDLKIFVTQYIVSTDSNYIELQSLSKRILADVTTLEPMIQQFNNISLDVKKRNSTTLMFDNFLLPINQKINTILNKLISNASLTGNGKNSIKIERLLRQIQYLWLQQAQSIKQFILNRSGPSSDREKNSVINLKSRKKFLLLLTKKLNTIKKIDSQSNKELIQTGKINNIIRLADTYNKQFERVRKIYMSDSWRKDVSLLDDSIQPQIDFVWEKLIQLQIIISALNQESIALTQITADKISQMIWFSALIILLGMFVIYIAFEFSLRRPIVAVAKALDAEAKGESGPPINKNYGKEIIELLNAFSNMRKQVKARQTRLQSILDNTLEGIVITNEQGEIESFNTAAENLFNYSSNEIIGKDISILIPSTTIESHQAKIQKYLKTGETTIIGKKRDVQAITRDGHIFPASIKITEMIIDGIRYFTSVIEDISQQKALMDDLYFQANHDSLTNLYNRYYFTTELEKVVNKHIRGNSNKYAIMYLDLDNFKYVNDTMGHLAGDQLLKEVATLLQNRIRKTDILARLGGDEFAILLYHNENLQLEYVSNNFREILSNYIFKYKGNIVDITCSIGSAYLNEDIKTKEHLLAKADIACHEAKRLGRNQAYIYSKSDDAQLSDMSRDIGWTGRIRDALENNKFILACQPIVNTQDNTISYYEVLLRMLDSDNKILMPFGFLPAAERFGLMLDIDVWVIKNSIALLAKQQVFNPNLKLSINLSAHSIDNNSTFEMIKNEIEKNKVNPEKLLFEVTETIAIANINTATSFLKNIQSLGCKTALDDFGVGYSSFAYLADLPIDVVKIDGFFVKEMATKSLNKTMVSAINDIAHELGKTTVAEFVEDQEIYDLLKILGVDYSQGYHLGKPEIIYDVTKNIDDLFTELNNNIANI